MKRFAFVTGILVLAAPLAMAQTSTWISDPAHSEVDFSITHMAISNVHGRFGHVTATIVYNDADVSKSTVNATIDVTGINTGEDARNNHLKSADFFDVANNPTAAFTSTSVTRKDGKLIVAGNLTLHGATKPVVLEVSGPVGPVPGMDPQHKLHSGFSAVTTIKRTDFGIGPKFPAAAVGDEVKISIDLDVVKQ
jgi:polyisoprenoid-binding protein YceI